MNFKDFHFIPPIARAIEKCGYKVPTTIQIQAIPHLILGRDLLGLAQTGTGKTATYVLPTLQSLQACSQKGVRALVLVPTRELAEQVFGNIRQLSLGTKIKTCTIYGGVSKVSQVNNINNGVDIIVACPRRLLDHINSKTVNLSSIEMLILDEADQMCDKGFLPDIRRIIKHVPKQRQSMVFSATMPVEVRSIVEDILSDPVKVQVNHDKPTSTINHKLFEVVQGQKTTLLQKILQTNDMSSALVFTRTKYKAKNLARQLQKRGFKATSLQGNLSQSQRKTAMNGFRSGKYNILVATDIAARGIDVSGISHAYNYDAPDTVEAFTHRVGRTGRAQESGQASTFATSDDGKIIRMIERSLGKIFSQKTLNGFQEQSKLVLSPETKGSAVFKEHKEKGSSASRRKRNSYNAKHRPTSVTLDPSCK